jgi:hypothetical protein
MTTMTCDLLMDFGAGLTSIIADALGKAPIHAYWGNMHYDPLTRVADIGNLNFVLNNSIANSNKTMGYYSPANSTAVRSGFSLETPVVLKLGISGSTAVKLKRFYISNINPVPGARGERNVAVTANDFMGRLANQNILKVPVQVNARTDQALATITALMPIPPLTTSFQVSPDVLPYIFDDISPNMAYMTAVQHLAMTDAGYVFACANSSDGESFQSHTRQWRQTQTSEVTLSADLEDMSVPSEEVNIWNDVVVSVFPASTGGGNETVYQIPNELAIQPGNPLTFQANYTDPNVGKGSVQKIRIVPNSGVTPVAGTDYKASFTSGGESQQDAQGNAPVPVEYTPNTNTVGLWHLNGNSTDASGHGNNGLDSNISYSSGKFNTAAFAGSTGGYINSPLYALGVIGTGDFTMSFWLNAAAPGAGTYTTLMNQNNNSNGPEIIFDPLNVLTLGNGIVFRVSSANSQIVTSPSASSLYGVWTNIIFTRVSGVCNVYYNGTLEKTFTDNTAITNALFCNVFGRSTHPAPSGMGMDEVIWEQQGTQAMVTAYLAAQPNLGINVTWYAAYAAVTLINNSMQTIYVNPFNLRAVLIRLYNQLDIRKMDVDSNLAKYGDRVLNYSEYYQTNPNNATDMANHWLQTWHLPTNVPSWVSYTANRNSTLAAAAINLCVGDRFTVTEPVTGLNKDFCIMGLDMTISPGSIATGPIVKVKYYPEPVNITPMFILDDATYGVLDTGPGTLGF